MVYGEKDKSLKGKGHMLHAYRLSFYHPFFGNKMEFTAKPPDYFLEKLSSLDLSFPV